MVVPEPADVRRVVIDEDVDGQLPLGDAGEVSDFREGVVPLLVRLQKVTGVAGLFEGVIQRAVDRTGVLEGCEAGDLRKE